jgi:hypothetical protein
MRLACRRRVRRNTKINLSRVALGQIVASASRQNGVKAALNLTRPLRTISVQWLWRPTE